MEKGKSIFEQRVDALHDKLANKLAAETATTKAATIEAAMQVVILTDVLSFVPDEITSGTIVLDGNVVKWELDRKPSPTTHKLVEDGVDYGNWGTYFEGDRQVIHPYSRCTKRYLLRFARKLSETEVSTIYNAIVRALQEKKHPDHCHCPACEKYHDEVIVPRIVGKLQKVFPDIERCE